MKYFLILCSSLLFPFIGKAQGSASGNESTSVAKGDTATKARVFNYVEQQPMPGFDPSEYLQANLHYPREARKANIEGKVIVKFVIDEIGTVSDVHIVRGIGGGCDEEAQRVVAAMPKWKPGTQNGKAVKVYFTLPINFVLEDRRKR